MKGGSYISSIENNTLKSVDCGHKYWIHRINLDDLSSLNNEKCIGAVNEKSRLIKEVNANDLIFLVTKRNNALEFFGYAKVEKVYHDNKPLYDYYKSKKKLKLKGIKYFTAPITTTDISENLSFVKNKKKSANFFKTEYREVSKEDFAEIRRKVVLTDEFPYYLDEFSMNLKEFILSTIKSVYIMVKHYETRNQIEIKKFLVILKKFLDGYGVNKSVSDLQEFYSRNAIDLGFKHIPSRDPDKFVPLCTYSGGKKNFAYISLE